MAGTDGKRIDRFRDRHRIEFLWRCETGEDGMFDVELSSFNIESSYRLRMNAQLDGRWTSRMLGRKRCVCWSLALTC